jgi:hypothetical protein
MAYTDYGAAVRRGTVLSEQGNASTEDLRKAMLEYWAIFTQLVETPAEVRS